MLSSVSHSCREHGALFRKFVKFEHQILKEIEIISSNRNLLEQSKSGKQIILHKHSNKYTAPDCDHEAHTHISRNSLYCTVLLHLFVCTVLCTVSINCTCSVLCYYNSLSTLAPDTKMCSHEHLARETSETRPWCSMPVGCSANANSRVGDGKSPVPGLLKPCSTLGTMVEAFPGKEGWLKNEMFK